MNRHLTTTLARPLAPLAAAALIGVCVIHLLDGPGSLHDQAYIGVLELSLAAASLPLAILLLIEPMRVAWATALALNLLALVVFVASRTVGLPGSTEDIGNWSPLLGLLNIAAELAVIAISVAALGWLRLAPHRISSHRAPRHLSAPVAAHAGAPGQPSEPR